MPIGDGIATGLGSNYEKNSEFQGSRDGIVTPNAGEVDGEYTKTAYGRKTGDVDINATKQEQAEWTKVIKSRNLTGGGTETKIVNMQKEGYNNLSADASEAEAAE